MAGESRARGPVAGLLTWLFAGALFGAPFLRTPEGVSWDGEDWRRAEDDYPFEEDVAYVEEVWLDEGVEIELAGPLAESSEELFGPGSAFLAASGLLELPRLEPGRREYVLHCAGCHGEAGDGAGPAARHLVPRPRNFRTGLFKFTSTASGAKPLREDLLRVVTEGLAGSAMPDFRLLPEEKRRDLVEYVRYLSMRGEYEELTMELAYEEGEVPDPALVAGIVADRWRPAQVVKQYPGTPETPRDAASVARGRALFVEPGRTNCAACHGEEGRGDGPTARDYLDEWGYPIVPRDLTTGVFRSGGGPEHLYLAIATGIGGTPMGSFDGNLTGEEIWDLVHFVQSLSDPDFESED